MAAYADLKADCLTIDHLTEDFCQRYVRRYRHPFGASLSNPTKMTCALTRDEALKIFCDSVRDCWGDEMPFVKALSEHDPDPLLRDAAYKLLESKAEWRPEPEVQLPIK